MLIFGASETMLSSTTYQLTSGSHIFGVLLKQVDNLKKVTRYFYDEKRDGLRRSSIPRATAFGTIMMPSAIWSWFCPPRWTQRQPMGILQLQPVQRWTMLMMKPCGWGRLPQAPQPINLPMMSLGTPKAFPQAAIP